MSQRPSSREDFEVAIICALPLEYDAVVLLFDEFWDEDGDTFGRAIGDVNNYRTGRIGKHNVVLALLSHMGKAHAAAAAASMRSSYGALRLVILAGICGGVPFNSQGEIFLGDVVISKSIIQYDFGRKYPNGFMRKTTDEDNLRKHGKNIRNFLTKFDTSSDKGRLFERTAYFLKQLQQKASKDQDKYKYPGIAEDKLFESSYRHKHRNSVACICNNCHGRKDPVCDGALSSSCDNLGCDEDYLVVRKQLKEQDEAQEPAIYIGAVASGDTVMKSGEDRDSIARRESVIAFEMEGAGVWEEMPCIVIKGVCDYADCHKNKLWQHFAAATAASASKAILEQYIRTDRGRGRFIQDSLRSLFLVPLRRNQDFIGRDTILSGLLEKIRPDANRDNCQRTIIEGLEGVGKTQIALEAAYLLHNEQPDCSIFWVPAADALTFEIAYRNIGKQLKIPQINQDETDFKQRVKVALSAESSGSWLLVVDNADNINLLFGPAGILHYLPFSRTGSILFTTRNHEAAVRLDILAESIFNIPEMSESEALSLLQEGLKRSQTSNIEASKRLLDMLANLPLAIRQASAYMATKHISTLDYLELCESEPKDMIDLLSRDFEDRHQSAKNPVAITWLISFSDIIQRDQLAAEYLKFISILAEEDIPKSLLPPATGRKAMHAIATLRAYAFITEREGEDSFDTHRLARLAMRNWLKKEGELKQCVTSAIQRLNDVVPYPKHTNSAEWMKYLQHAQAVLELSEYSTSKEAEASLFTKVAEGHNRLGQYQIGEQIHRKAIKLREKVFGKYDQNTLVNMSRLADTLYNLGKFPEAEEVYRQTFKLKEEVLGLNHPSTLQTMNYLATALRRLSRYREAEQIYRQIFTLKEKVLGTDHPSTLDSMNCFASILSDLGKYKEAEKLHQEALKLNEVVFGKNHPATLNSMTNLALVFFQLNKLEDAEKLQWETLDRRERVFGKEDLSTLDSMGHLANTISVQGRYKEAEELLQQSFKLKKKVLGKDTHPAVLKDMHSLGLVLYQLGKYMEAAKLQEETLELKKEVFGRNHPTTLDAMNSFACVLRKLGRSTEAEKLHRQTLAFREEVFGKSHPATIDSMHNLANLFSDSGRYIEAEELRVQTLKLRREWLARDVL